MNKAELQVNRLFVDFKFDRNKHPYVGELESAEFSAILTPPDVGHNDR